MNIFLILLSLFLLQPDSPVHIHGSITDAGTGTAVTGAHVFVYGSNRGTISDQRGNFHLDIAQGDARLVVSHIGYERYEVYIEQTDHQKLEINLKPSGIRSEYSVIITSEKMNMDGGYHNNVNTRTSEEYLKSLAEVDLVTRANFAKEPVIRGMQSNRIDILVDGMRLTPACVDGMDPQTAYIETQNLSAISLDKGSGSRRSPGGGINFELETPTLDSGLQSGFESSYQSVSHQQFYQGYASYGDEHWALRFSGTYRDAGDFVAGNGQRMDESGFRKGNLHGSLVYAPVEDHKFHARYIGDFAADIGYPALLMDTRRADAHITGLDHDWQVRGNVLQSVSTTLYYNQVDHWMDDYQRDVMARDVMADMYMPMYGKTQTGGISSNMTLVSGRHLMDVELESWGRYAFADMLMEPINPEIPDMYLVNLAGVRQWNKSLATVYSRFFENDWELEISGRMESGLNQLTNNSAVAVLAAYYPQLNTIEPTHFTWRAGAEVRKYITPQFLISLGLNHGTRLPSHLELFGYYIYQPLDDYFYIGNPGLSPEKSSMMDVNVRRAFPESGIETGLSVWMNYFDDYITGRPQDETFSIYENTGEALMAGFELDANLPLTEKISIKNRLGYTWGQHLDFDEPLPMMPPLIGSHQLQFKEGDWTIRAQVLWSSAQERIAYQSSKETETPGYWTADFSVDYALSSNISLLAGIDNIMDKYYRNHLSVNRFPEPGRNLYLALMVRM